MPGELRGWQPDPYCVHELRYFTANGRPSRLVRDGSGWSNDEPPSGSWTSGSPLSIVLAEHNQSVPAGMAVQSDVIDRGPAAWSNPIDERLALIRERLRSTQGSPLQPTPRPEDHWGTPVAHPEGWYEDPSDPDQHRYWDGDGWTQDTHRLSLSPMPSAAPLYVGSADPGITLTGASAATTEALLPPEEQRGGLTERLRRRVPSHLSSGDGGPGRSQPLS